MTHAEMVEEIIKLHEWVQHWSQRAEAAETALADAQSRLLHTQAGLTIWMERSKSNARELDEAYDAMCEMAKTLDCTEDWAAIKAALKETLGKVWELATASSALVSALNTCHVCAGEVCLDTTESTHCEDCSADCECHGGDACVPIYVLVDNTKTAIRAALAGKS